MIRWADGLGGEVAIGRRRMLVTGVVTLVTTLTLATPAEAQGGSDEVRCGETGGVWDPLACGHYMCGLPVDCTAVVPGCDCGPGRSFVADVGCIDDPTCDNYCPADLDGDWHVGADDLITVILAWGPCADCPEDLNGSGEVDVAELVRVLLDWGSCLFDYGLPRENAEAEQIALETLGPGDPLIVPGDVYERVVRDQALIRDALSELAPVTHSASWPSDLLIVQLAPYLPREDYATLNTYYQVTDEQLIGQGGGSESYELNFPGRLNMLALARIYAELEEVELATRVGAVGQPTWWRPTVMSANIWRWDVESGWMDRMAFGTYE